MLRWIFPHVLQILNITDVKKYNIPKPKKTIISAANFMKKIVKRTNIDASIKIYKSEILQKKERTTEKNENAKRKKNLIFLT